MSFTHLIRCGGCGTVSTLAAFGSAIGPQCPNCATHAHCHDCGQLMPRDLLTDFGDGYQTCDDCQLEVVARMASATVVHR